MAYGKPRHAVINFLRAFVWLPGLLLASCLYAQPKPTSTCGVDTFRVPLNWRQWQPEQQWAGRWNNTRQPAVRAHVAAGASLPLAHVKANGWPKSLRDVQDSMSQLPDRTPVLDDYAMWIAIPLCNPTNENQMWEVSTAHVDSVSLVWQHGLMPDSVTTRVWVPEASDENRLFHYYNRESVAGIILVPAGASDTLFLRLRRLPRMGSILFRSVNPWVLIRPVTYTTISDNLASRTNQAIALGAMAALLFLNLVVLVWLRDRVHFWFVVLLGLLFLLSLSETAIYGVHIFRRDIQGWHLMLFLPNFFLLPVLVRFGSLYLRLKQYTPRWVVSVFRGLEGWGWLQGLTFLVVYLLHRFQVVQGLLYADWVNAFLKQPAYYATLLLIPALTITALYVWRKGHVLGWVLAVGSICLLAFSISMVLHFGFDFKLNVSQLLDYTLVGVMLVFQMGFLQLFIEQRNQLAQAERARNIALRSQNERLEAEVKHRTAALATQNQQLQMAMEQLQEASAEKDEIMGIAAHDLKNPIAAIQLFSSLLQDPAQNSLEDAQTYGRKIADSAGQMMAIVVNLLDMYRLEQGNYHMDMLPVDMTQVVQTLFNQYEERARLKNIQLHLHTQPAPPAIAWTNPQRALQVIDNLLSNALKFSPHGLSVTVLVRVLNLEVLVTVADEGPGLTEEDQQQLFRKFARLSARPTAGESSTGLGLSIVHHLVELMEGRVTVHSEPGKGAAFTVYLPLASAYQSVNVPIT